MPGIRLATRGVYDYAQCDACQSLQIVTIPPDLDRYYTDDDLTPPPSGPLRAHMQRLRDAYLLWGHDPGLAPIQRWLGRWLAVHHPEPAGASLGSLRITRSARVLDVGCGHGVLLNRLAALGFAHLTGVDPFTRLASPRGWRFVPGTLDALPASLGPWDVIMLHHSLEHVPDPAATLRAARARLAPGGVCIVRTPVIPCAAWDHYRIHWVQIDAPRHLFIASRAALSDLAGAAGLRLTRMVADSTAFQFWGSAQAQRGIPLDAAWSYAVHPARSAFRPAQLRAFERAAQHLNRIDQGDQVAAYLAAAD